MRQITLIISILFLTSFSTNGRQDDNIVFTPDCISFQTIVDKSLLIGKWKLTSHSYINNKKTKYCDCKTYSPETLFQADGTYKMTLNGKLIQTGKWKIQTPDIIFFYNNQDVPDDPLALISDNGHKIISLTKNKLIIKEVICSEADEGESVYVKLK